MMRHAKAGLVLVVLAVSWSTTRAADTLSDKVYLSELLKRMYEYKTELPTETLRQAVGVQGERSRLERAVMKLIKGEPVNLALIGGSISVRGWNHFDESYIRQVHKWVEVAFLPGCKAEAVKKQRGGGEEGSTGSRRLLSGEPRRAGTRQEEGDRRWLSNDKYREDERPDASQDLHCTTHAGYLATGHMCDSISKVNLTSLAVPAAGPGYADRCVVQKVPEDVDLVIVDFGVNDYQSGNFFSHPERHAYERILRHFLSMDHAPGVLLFEAYSWSDSFGYFLGTEHEVHSGQDKHSIMAEYYGNVQLLSVRSALYQILNSSAPKDPDMHAFDPRVIYLGDWGDQLHVSLTGHRWYADIIITYIRQVATDLIMKMMALQSVPEDVRSTMAASIGHPLDAAAAAVDPGCVVHGNRGTDFPLICTAPNSLRPPLFPGNEARRTGVCALGSDFQQTVTKHDGWEWVDEGHDSAHKWGYVSTQVGSKLTISLDLGFDGVELDLEHPYSSSNRVTGFLIYLISYKGMGIAQLSCAGSCKCHKTAVDAHTKEQHSVPEMVEFKMYRRAALNLSEQEVPAGSAARNWDAELCEVKLEVLSNSSSPDQGHKFKAIGITTSSAAVWHMEDIVKKGNEQWVES